MITGWFCCKTKIFHPTLLVVKTTKKKHTSTQPTQTSEKQTFCFFSLWYDLMTLYVAQLFAVWHDVLCLVCCTKNQRIIMIAMSGSATLVSYLLLRSLCCSSSRRWPMYICSMHTKTCKCTFTRDAKLFFVFLCLLKHNLYDVYLMYYIFYKAWMIWAWRLYKIAVAFAAFFCDATQTKERIIYYTNYYSFLSAWRFVIWDMVEW